MINDDFKILIPEDFEDDMQVITTIFNSTKDVGLVIAGEDMYPNCNGYSELLLSSHSNHKKS
jgi:hypothetical protein